jgi:hypothetical protein
LIAPARIFWDMALSDVVRFWSLDVSNGTRRKLI